MALKRTVQPKLNPGGSGYYVHFRHALRGKGVKAGLGTTEEATARLICEHLVTFSADPPSFAPVSDLAPVVDVQAAADKAVAAGYHPVAVKVWFGVQPAAKQATPWEERIEALCDVDAKARQFFREYVPLLEDKVRVLEPRVQELEAEVARLRRQCGVQARVALRAAVAAWVEEYPTGRAERTVREAKKVVEDFRDWAETQRGKKVYVGQIRRGDVAKWLAGVRSSRPASAGQSQGGGGAVAHDGTAHARARGVATDTVQTNSTGGRDARAELSPITRKKFRAYLSTFFAWARNRYDLPENPAREIDVPGVSRSAEDIQAIRRYDDLVEIAAALRDWPYWRALWLTGVLAGPRWDELRKLRVADVGLHARTITIRAEKTGRQRSTPIEGSLLLPALRQHLERRARERQGEDVDLPLFGGPDDGAQPETIRAAARSDLLFPSYVDEGTRPRTKTEPGLWSDSSTFLRAWRRAIRAAWRLQSNAAPWSSAPPAWRFQPREWRHSAGSAMGHCGCSSLQISQWLGNSEAIARRHYIPPVSGHAWPLNYGG